MLLTGGCGFIGSNLARWWLAAGGEVVDLDGLTYAGDARRVRALEGHGYVRVEGDVADAGLVASVLSEVQPHAVVHMAAESHVTRSESAPEVFHGANVEGTRVLLEALTKLNPSIVMHVSTDEVYGSCPDAPFREDEKGPGEGRATSAYARSKALADDVAVGFADRLPMIVVRPTNCFGPWQHPEKAFPRWITRGLRGLQLPVWGDGGYVRDWLPVEDLCEAILLLLRVGKPGEVYNVGPSRDPEITNETLARWVGRVLGLPDDHVVLTVYDRPGHDRRYAVDASKIRALGWRPDVEVWSRFGDTVEWYRANRWWWEPMIASAEAIYADRVELQEVIS